MSVSDPLVKDLKGCVQQFLKITTDNETISDNNFYFILFCQTIEKIFDKGLIRQQHTKYFSRTIDSYAWMVGVSKSKSDVINFSYVDCVEKVKERKDVHTNEGRFRLLVKFCLMKKCLHVPVEYLKNSGNTSLFYLEYSILGDEILSEILLSVLFQLARIKFSLDLGNSCFLDVSWYLPELVNIELVPSKNLGVSVSFADNRAVVVNVESNSVAAEVGLINVGDVLEKLNGIHISSSLKGKLGSVLRSSKKQPINLTIAKAFNNDTREIYGPIENLLKILKLDLETIKNQYDEGYREIVPKKPGSGFEVDYIGTVDLGEIGSVKQVQKALKCMLCQSENNSSFLVTHVGKKVVFEIGEIGVKVKESGTGDEKSIPAFEKISVIYKDSKHNETTTSRTNIPPEYFLNMTTKEANPSLFIYKIYGYYDCPYTSFNFADAKLSIVDFAGGVPEKHFSRKVDRDENCDTAEKFICHIFEVKKFEDADLILQSLGQGFQRTHYAV